jgi:hypothetical protein
LIQIRKKKEGNIEKMRKVEIQVYKNIKKKRHDLDAFINWHAVTPYT